jgi:trigger factor
LPATLKVLDPTQVELEIEIPTDELEKARESAFRRLAKNARVPGFRPGKVPRKIFVAQYGEAAIDERAMEDIVPQIYARAIEEHDLEPIERPSMELLPGEDDGPVRFKAVVSVRPRIELGAYKDVDVTDVVQTATDQDLEDAIERLRKDAATLVPVDRPVQMGDVATIDYEGKIDGVPFEGGTSKGEATEIAESRFIPGFAAGIVGMTAGETKDVEATFPADYQAEDLAGKTAVFTITVHEIKEPELPALDDDFAKRVAQKETVEELRADVKLRLDEMTKGRARQTMIGELVDKLAAAHEVPLPLVLVEREIDSLLNDSKQYVARYGTTWDDYLEATGKTEQAFRDDFRAEAEKRVKSTLLIEAIAKAEKIKATQGDLDNEIGALSRQYRQPPEKIVEMLQGNVGSLVDGIVRTKTLDFLLENAKHAPAATSVAAE